MKMKLNEILIKSFLEIIPIILMIVLIAIIKNDYLLLLIYIILIIILFKIKYEKNEIYILVITAILLTFFEYIFVSTGVEIFLRKTLLNVMPIWLPVLWGYSLVAGKRVILYIDKFKN